MKVLGHRGLNQPENLSQPYQNTLEAFEAALNAGTAGIELDVIASRDGKCFIIHDEDISKHSNFSTGIITELDSSEIKNLRVGKGSSYKLPTLTEVFDLFKGKNKLINIEIKQPGIEELILKEIAGYDFPLDNILISSFNHADLISVRNINSKILIGLLFGRESRENKYFEQYILDLSERLAPTAFMMEKTLSYLSVLESRNEKYFWTIKKEDIENSRVEGLNMYENVNLITDYPKELIDKINKTNL